MIRGLSLHGLENNKIVKQKENMGIKERVTARVVDLFPHSERPLQNTEKYEGDPGLFGPGSISWEVLGDALACWRNQAR